MSLSAARKFVSRITGKRGASSHSDSWEPSSATQGDSLHISEAIREGLQTSAGKLTNVDLQQDVATGNAFPTQSAQLADVGMSSAAASGQRNTNLEPVAHVWKGLLVLSRLHSQRVYKGACSGDEESIVTSHPSVEEPLKSCEATSKEIALLNAGLKRERRKYLECKARLTALKGLLECPVCTSPMQDPHTLNCGHIACSACIQSWFVACEAPIFATPHLLRVNSCPVCRCHVRQPVPAYLVRSIVNGLVAGEAASYSPPRFVPGTGRAHLNVNLSSVRVDGLALRGVCIAYSAVFEG